jgi:hypothetical protein
LRASINALSNMAYTWLETPENRVNKLREQILITWNEEIVNHGSTLSERDIYALLAVDAELNAQGLDIWLQRLAQGKTSLGFRQL